MSSIDPNSVPQGVPSGPQNPTGPQGDPARPPETSEDAGAPATDLSRELVLVKRGQRHVFRYVPGEESQMLAGLAEMARDPKSGIDWFDAAVLSHQMGRTLSQQLNQMLKPKSKAS